MSRFAGVPAPWDRILEAARWSPSGDNAQTWRFEVVDESAAVIRAWDVSDHVLYDHRRLASMLGLGMMHENIRIAAAEAGYRADIRRIGDQGLTFLVELAAVGQVAWSGSGVGGILIRERCTNRGHFDTTPLSPLVREALDAAARPLAIRWITGWRERWRIARLLYDCGRLRLRPQCLWRAHRASIDLRDPFSPRGIPLASLPLDPLMRCQLRWAMASWPLFRFLVGACRADAFASGELDLLPNLRSGAHAVLLGPPGEPSFEGLLAAGAAVQRVWLAATAAGLQVQPQFTPVVWHWIRRDGLHRDPSLESPLWDACAERWSRICAGDPDRGIFALRLGHGSKPRSRSGRLDSLHLLGSPPVSDGRSHVGA